MVWTLLVTPTPPRKEQIHRYQIGIHEAILPDRR
jgi:phosphatidylethanolamine-binding protein (PEBP) family uncharacterized protein